MLNYDLLSPTNAFEAEILFSKYKKNKQNDSHDFHDIGEENDQFLDMLGSSFQSEGEILPGNIPSPQELKNISDFSFLQNSSVESSGFITKEELEQGHSSCIEGIEANVLPLPKNKLPVIERNVDKKLSDSDPSRIWEVCFRQQEFDSLKVKLLMKNRIEKPTELVPEIFYSSIQYQILIEIEQCNSSSYSFFLAKAFVMDSETGEKLTKDLKNKEPLKGTIECAVSRQTEKGAMKGTLKCKLGDLTYHKRETHYYIQVELFTPDNLTEHVMVIRTPIFRVYSRKPNKKRARKKETKKRAKEVNDRLELDEPSTKKRKNSSKLDNFECKLDDLLEVTKKLKGGNKQKAFEMMLQRIYEEFNQ